MSQFPSPCFRLFTELGSLPRSRTKYFVQGHIESLGHTRETMAGVRPPSHLLTTLLHHAIHNPTTWKSLPLQLHRPDTSVKGVGFPGERQRELQDIPCASSTHTIKLFPYYLIHSSPHTAIPFYFCPVFYYLLTYRTASCTQQKVSLYHDAGCYPGLFLHTWQLGCF